MMMMMIVDDDDCEDDNYYDDDDDYLSTKVWDDSVIFDILSKHHIEKW